MLTLIADSVKVRLMFNELTRKYLVYSVDGELVAGPSRSIESVIDEAHAKCAGAGYEPP